MKAGRTGEGSHSRKPRWCTLIPWRPRRGKAEEPGTGKQRWMERGERGQERRRERAWREIREPEEQRERVRNGERKRGEKVREGGEGEQREKAQGWRVRKGEDLLLRC